MASQAPELARRFAREAEAVCRRYLSNGRRQGRYWVVGDVANTPGRSLFVRLTGPDSGKGAAGKWTDAGTGEHGDLLDLIALSMGLDHFGDVLDEARAFLGLPRVPPPSDRRTLHAPAPIGSPESARRLFAASRPIARTIAETYLRSRGITAFHETAALRFHPRCYYRPDADVPTEVWPALIAAVTDLAGMITGAHRTWLDPSGDHKAPVDTPRRAMGHLLGHGVRFGIVSDVMAAGEGIETMLSLRSVLPRLPVLAALSANHLAAILLPGTLRRLYIARDHDLAGDVAVTALTERARAAGIEALTLSSALGDFNEDLRHLGIDELRTALRVQLPPEDVQRFLPGCTSPGQHDACDAESRRRDRIGSR
jgi:Toprim domain